MSLLVVGTIALDKIDTPDQSREGLLGGSAVYFSYAASFFAPVHLVGVVGDDWPSEYTQLLQARQIDTSGMQAIPGTKTFRWYAEYAAGLAERKTLDVQLNVYGAHKPVLSEHLRRCPIVFLANGSPTLQLEILSQMTGPQMIIADTIEMWIRETRDELHSLLQRVNGFMLSDSEAHLLTQEDNLVRAGMAILELGPSFVVIKKGEHGAMFFSRHETYVLPAFPTQDVVDPTGAGDAFAGGMMGYLAQQGNFEPESLKRAIAYGILVASFVVEDFSLDRLRHIEQADISLRMERYRRMLSF